jgi:hypothetical protein
MPVLRRTRPAPVAPDPGAPATLGWSLGMACRHPRAGNAVIDAFANLSGIWYAFVRHSGYHRNTCRVDELLPPLTGPRVLRRR